MKKSYWYYHAKRKEVLVVWRYLNKAWIWILALSFTNHLALLFAPTIPNLFVPGALWNKLHSKPIRPVNYLSWESPFKQEAEAPSSMELIFQTNWGSATHPRIIGEYLNAQTLNDLVALRTALDGLSATETTAYFNQLGITNPLILKFAPPPEAIAKLYRIDLILPLLKRFHLKEINLAYLIDFGFRWQDMRCGIKIPVCMQLSHPWVSLGTQKEIATTIDSMQDISSLGIGTIQLDNTQEKNPLEKKIRTISKDFGIGDIRLYIQNRIIDRDLWQVDFGQNIIIPTSDLEEKYHSSDLSPQRNQLQLNYFKSVIAGINNLDLDTKAAKQIFMNFTNNLISTLHYSGMRSQIDYHRYGIGGYTLSKMRSEKHNLSLMSKNGLDYLMGTRDHKLFSFTNAGSIETSLLSVKLSPILIAYTQTVVGYERKNWLFQIGYDYFYKPHESIEAYNNKIDNFAGTGISATPDWEEATTLRTETPSLHEFRIMAGIAKKYYWNEWLCDWHLNWNLAFGAIRQRGYNWGINLGWNWLF